MGIAIRTLSIVTILALLLGNRVIAPVAAVGEVTVSINAPTNVNPGDNFTATVDIGQVVNFDAANYDVSFNPAVLRLDNVTAGLIGDNVTPVDYWGQYPPGTPGTYRIIHNFPGLPGINPPYSSPITGSGYLAKLHFTVIGSAGSNSNISLSNGVLGDTLSEEIPAVWVGDSVQVSGVDTTPPTVISTVPLANATNVPINTTITVNFSESMNATSVQGAFSISPTVSGSFSWADYIMTFTPATNLTNNTTYTVTIGTAARDLAGIPLAQAYIWSFTTALPAVGAHFSIQPSTKTVGIGQIFTVDIQVDASTQSVDTVGAYVNFDTTYLKVVDATGNVISGTANDVITPGPITTTLLTQKLKNQVDNTNGYTDISYGMPLGGTPANTLFVLGTIRFKALAEVQNAALFFNTSGIRNTKAVREGVTVTGDRIDGSVTVAALVLLKIQVALEFRPPVGNDAWVIPVDVWLHSEGTAWTESAGHDSLFYFASQTSNQGIIEVFVEPGTYDIRVKGITTLKNLARSVVVSPPGPVEINLGVLVEGDTNDDNMVDEVDYSTVVMRFGSEVGASGAPPQTRKCDFNNDGYVDEVDYSIIIARFGRYGADIQ